MTATGQISLVNANGSPRISWQGNQVNIGGTDMFYNGNISYINSVFRMQSYNSNISFECKGGSGTANKDIIFRPFNGTADTEAMRIKGDGKVGIGTTSPDSKLHLESGNAHNKLSITSTASGGTGYDAVIDLLGSASNSEVQLNMGINGDADREQISTYQSDMKFKTNNTERMRITSAGNVGIGTTSPSAKFHIHSTSGDGLVRITGDNIINSGGAIKGFNNGLAFNVAASGGGSEIEAIRIQGNGNVGIGTTSPSGGAIGGKVVHLVNSGGTASFRVDRSDSSTTGTISLIDTNSTIGLYGTGQKPMAFSTNSTERMRLTSNGDLHVDADIIGFSTTISDQRLKEKIITIDGALDKVKNLRGVSYYWNSGNKKGKKDLGVIAQEVEKVLPEIVVEKKMEYFGDKNYKTVDYEKLTAVLIESVKELSAKVEALENKCCNCK